MGQYIYFRFVKANASFEALLQRYGIETKGTGDERSALCPFHDEAKPSFKVNLRKGGFHCFGCGAKGNVLDFVAKLERCDLREAAVIVAQASGIGLSERTEGAETSRSGRKGAKGRKRPETAHTAPQAATGARNEAPPAQETADKPQACAERNPPLSFRLNLDPEHPYLRGRLSSSLIQHFELGYCDRGLMKGRIAILIHDDDGELVAYAGRWADDEVPKDVEKYLLPPKFRKSLVLFNLSRLLRPIEHVVVVEGFFGAMRLHGLEVPVVALMGSSIAEAQVVLLRDAGVVRVSLMLDGDDPGRAAALVMLPVLARSFFVRTFDLPEGEQPDTVDEVVLRELVEHEIP
jgi:DNA primase